MKEKREPKKSKSIKEKTTTKNYSGEASPYRDFMERRQDPTDEGNPTEDMLANPDVLPEDASLYHRPLSEDGELRVEVIKEVMATLSSQQQQILTLCGFEGRTETAAAQQLGMTRRALRTQLGRIRQKIQRRYEQRQKTELR